MCSHVKDLIMLNLMCIAVKFYVITVVTAAAIVVPCLSTLVSDHGEYFLFLFVETHTSF